MKKNDIFEELRKQEQLVQSTPTFFLHYNLDTKQIINLRNYLEVTDSYPFIEVTEKDLGFSIKDIDISKYKISVGEDKKVKLEEIQHKAVLTNIDDYIYQIPKVSANVRLTAADISYDVLIEQNNKDKKFRIKLAKEFRERFASVETTKQRVYVYVTAVDDPNILYKTLNFSFADLVFNEFHTIDFDDFKGNQSNIYSMRFFQQYLHVDIR